MRKTARKLSALALAAFLSMAVLTGCTNQGPTEGSGNASTGASSQEAVSGADQNSTQISQQNSTLFQNSIISSSPSTPSVTESSAPVQISEPVPSSSTPAVESSSPTQISTVQPSAAPQGDPISIKAYFDQNGGDKLLKTIEKQNSNEQMDVHVYFDGEDMIVFEMQYKQNIPMDEDTKAALVKYFDTNFDSMKPTFRQQFAPMNTLNIKDFDMTVIVKNGDGSLLYQTVLDLSAEN